MPAPNAKSIKSLFDDAAKTYEKLGPEYAIKHVIEAHSLSAEDIALAWLAPEALDNKSKLTKEEQQQFDASLKADEERRKAEEKEAKAAEARGDRAPAPRATAPVADDFSGKSDPNPKDGSDKMPPVGGGVEVKSPAQRK